MMTPRRMTGELEDRLNGPHSPDHTAQAAFLAAETVRFLIYATGTHAAAGLPWPSASYEVLGSLKIAADRLPQLLNQLAGQMKRDRDAGLLGHDTRDPGQLAISVAEFERCLADAAVHAGSLAVNLSAAQSAIAAVNGRGPSRPGEDL